MKFSYKALKNGKSIKGSIEADDVASVAEYLRSNDFVIVNIREGTRDFLPSVTNFFNKIKFSEIVDLTRQLAIMLNSGLSIAESLDILKRQAKKPIVLKLVTEIDEDVRAGNSLSSSLKKHPDIFSKLYIALVKAGEASGKLDDIMKRLADSLEKQRNFQSKTKSALIYPALIVVAMLTVMFIMITFVIPKLLTLYESFDIELPLPTRILIALSSFMQSYWLLIIIAVFAGIYFLRNFLKTRAGKKKFDTIILHIPLIQKVIRVAALVTSTRILSILIQAGVPILQSLDIIVDVTTNSVYKDSFIRVRAKIEKGSGLGKSLEDEQIFPPIFVQMTTVGEKTGHLDETLTHLSRYFENEAEMAIRAVTVLIEPLILVVLGVGVGFVVIAVITPIFNLTSSF